MQKFKSVEELVNQLKPEKPVYCIRKHSVTKASDFFLKNLSILLVLLLESIL